MTINNASLINNINNENRDLENRKINLLYKLGKDYFDKNLNNENDPYKSIFDEIINIDKTIEENKEKIDRLNNIVRCKECNAILPYGVSFCTNCGTKLPEPKKYKNCPICGKEVEESSLFCNNCGHKFVEKKKCPSCGNEVDDDSSFCMNCGFKLIETNNNSEEVKENIIEATSIEETDNNLIKIDENQEVKE